GYQAGNGNTTGSANTVIGVSAAFANTTGSSNTVIGDGAGSLLDGGDNNIIIGADAGDSLTTGSNNVYIGGYAGTAAADGNVVLSDGLGDIRLISNDAAGVTTQGMRLYMMQDDLALTSGSKTGLLVDESFSGSYVVNPASGTLNWTGMEV